MRFARGVTIQGPKFCVIYLQGLRQVVADINCNFSVGDLCKRLPDRLDELIRRQGDRLRA